MAPKTPPATPRTPAPRRRPDVPVPAGADIAIPKVLDLNARAAARAKAQKVAPKVIIGAVTYDLPTELRLDTLRGVFKLLNGNIDGLDTLLFDLFGEDAVDEPTAAELAGLDTKAQAARRKAYNPAFRDLTLDDIEALFMHVGEAYGIDLGKLPESTGS